VTGRPESLELVVYGRRDCALCDEMAEAVLALAGGRVRLSIVDIDDDQELSRRFSADVPVLCLGEEVVCRHFLDPDRLQRLLDGMA
jgi:hypothetical protein